MCLTHLLLWNKPLPNPVAEASSSSSPSFFSNSHVSSVGQDKKAACLHGVSWGGLKAGSWNHKTEFPHVSGTWHPLSDSWHPQNSHMRRPLPVAWVFSLCNYWVLKGALRGRRLRGEGDKPHHHHHWSPSHLQSGQYSWLSSKGPYGLCVFHGFLLWTPEQVTYILVTHFPHL